MKLQTELAPKHKSGLLLKNPVMVASGTFGYGIEYAKIAEIQRLGAIISNGITLYPRNHHQTPQTIETAAGLLYTPRLQNPGIRAVIKKYAPVWATWQTPVIINLVGETMDEMVELAELLEGIPGVAAIELNVAALHMLKNEIQEEVDERFVMDTIVRVRHASTLPLIVKLSPYVNDLRSFARTMAVAGVDAISLINSIAGIAINISTRRPQFSPGGGALSGPAIKPIALRMVYEVATELRGSHPHVPIIGLGGIMNAHDALEFLMAGATAIQVGTINFVNPHAGIDIIEGIEAFLQQEGVQDVKDIIGVALPSAQIADSGL